MKSGGKWFVALIILLSASLFLVSIILSNRIHYLKQDIQIKSQIITQLKRKINKLEYNINVFQNRKIPKCNNNTNVNKQNIAKWINDTFSKAYPTLAQNVIKYTYKYSNEPLVLLSLISVESSYDFQTISSKGAYGGTQIQCSSWKDKLIKQGIIDKSCKELFNPEKSIRAGAYVLDYYIQKCGSLQGGLSAYLTGTCTINKYSRSYVSKVYQYLAELYLISKN